MKLRYVNLHNFDGCAMLPNASYVVESEGSPKYQKIPIIFLDFSSTKLSYRTRLPHDLHSLMTYIRLTFTPPFPLSLLTALSTPTALAIENALHYSKME